MQKNNIIMAKDQEEIEKLFNRMFAVYIITGLAFFAFIIGTILWRLL